ncbi:MAG: hypothetical protein ACOCXZ_03520, partial [Chloroflexota bacterium]
MHRHHRWRKTWHITAIIGLLVCLGLLTGPAAAQEETEEPTASPTVDAPPGADTATPTVTPTPEGPTETATPGPPTPTPPPTNTPRPDVADFVFDWSEDILYPQAAYFELVLDLPLSDVAALTLNIQPQGEARGYSVDDASLRAAAVITEPFTEIEYIWTVPPQDPPRFEALVNYTWEVITGDGRTAIVPGVFAFSDPRIDWVQESSADGPLTLFYPADTINEEVLRGTLSRVYELLSGVTGRRPAFRLLLTGPGYALDPCASQETITGPRSGVVVPCEGDVVDTIIANLNA